MAAKTALKVGAKAPTFNLPTDEGNNVALKDLAGKIVVLFFYPKDDTPGCTLEARDFTATLGRFKRVDAVVIGISKDSVAKHGKFRSRHGLKVILGSDEDGKVIERYGVLVPKNMFGRKYMGIERSTFVIDRSGKIAHIWRKVNVLGHADDVLGKVKELAKAE